MSLKHRRNYNLQIAGKFRNYFKSFPPSFTRSADKLIRDFQSNFNSLECKEILGSEFQDWCDFQEKRASKTCEAILSFVETYVGKALEEKL